MPQDLKSIKCEDCDGTGFICRQSCCAAHRCPRGCEAQRPSYYTKDRVYGDDPLMEIIYEIEDCLITAPFDKFVLHSDLKDIFERHTNTIKQFRADEHEELYPWNPS